MYTHIYIYIYTQIDLYVSMYVSIYTYTYTNLRSMFQDNVTKKSQQSRLPTV